jgi:hypothetical protein
MFTNGLCLYVVTFKWIISISSFLGDLFLWFLFSFDFLYSFSFLDDLYLWFLFFFDFLYSFSFLGDLFLWFLFSFILIARYIFMLFFIYFNHPFISIYRGRWILQGRSRYIVWVDFGCQLLGHQTSFGLNLQNSCQHDQRFVHLSSVILFI